jgi:hypothetical protein
MALGSRGSEVEPKRTMKGNLRSSSRILFLPCISEFHVSLIPLFAKELSFF